MIRNQSAEFRVQPMKTAIEEFAFFLVDTGKRLSVLIAKPYVFERFLVNVTEGVGLSPVSEIIAQYEVPFSADYHSKRAYPARCLTADSVYAATDFDARVFGPYELDQLFCSAYFL